MSREGWVPGAGRERPDPEKCCCPAQCGPRSARGSPSPEANGSAAQRGQAAPSCSAGRAANLVALETDTVSGTQLPVAPLTRMGARLTHRPSNLHLLCEGGSGFHCPGKSPPRAGGRAAGAPRPQSPPKIRRSRLLPAAVHAADGVGGRWASAHRHRGRSARSGSPRQPGTWEAGRRCVLRAPPHTPLARPPPRIGAKLFALRLARG